MYLVEAAVADPDPAGGAAGLGRALVAALTDGVGGHRSLLSRVALLGERTVILVILGLGHPGGLVGRVEVDADGGAAATALDVDVPRSRHAGSSRSAAPTSPASQPAISSTTPVGTGSGAPPYGTSSAPTMRVCPPLASG